jgi:hypothetical protein
MILTGDVMSANVLIEDIGDISPPRTGKMLNKSISFRIPGPHQALNIFFSAKKGWWTELLRLEEVNGKWVYAILVVRHNASDTQGPVGKRLVSPDYPPNLLVEDRDWVSLAKRYKHPR